MRKQQLAKPSKRKNKAQSLVELSLILLILLTLLTGMVEFGNLLNQYINIVDGAREGARFVSNDDPFTTITIKDEHGNDVTVSNYEYFFGKVYQVVQGRYETVGGVEVQISKGAIDPIVLSKENGDDIVATFFSVTGDSRRGPPNLCTSPGTIQHLERFTPKPPNPASRYSNHVSQFTDGQVSSMLDGCAPNAGVLLVEVFYNYNQILQMYSLVGVPDPIQVHAYSMMPLSAGEPTPTPP